MAFIQEMQEEIAKVGGKLTFSITTHEDGWSAECNEFDGIITGGTNAHATEEEMLAKIKDAIDVAFCIPQSHADKVDTMRPISSVTELELVPTLCHGR
jgi:predicted RNase H-like HicB family nuclease